MLAYLEKSKGSEGFHEIIDFLSASHIHYALTENPTIYVSFIKQFWSTTTASTRANEEVELIATIDGQVKTLNRASLKRHLKLEDNGGVTTLPNSEIFEQLALMGYVTDFDKLTFQKVEGLESELKHTKQTYNAALIKLIQRVKKLEQTVKTTKARRRARIVVSEDEDALEDSSKQGRKISDIDEDLNIYLVLLEEEEPTELVEDKSSGEKDEKEITTPANFQTYIRRRGVSTTGKWQERASLEAAIRLKRGGQEKSAKKQVEEEIVQQKAEQDVKESIEKVGRRKKSLARKRGRETLSEESSKKQKLEDDAEKEELQVYLNIVSEDEGLDVESLATKYPIVDWETQILANKYYYQIKRANGSVKHYNLFSGMLYDFDRQDVLELYRLVKEIFQIASPEGYDLLLWGDLKTMMEPNAEDETWRNQQD
ncbi:hypothetical protein Tco_0222198 [Tanacetum coccineum]